VAVLSDILGKPVWCAASANTDRYHGLIKRPRWNHKARTVCRKLIISVATGTEEEIAEGRIVCQHCRKEAWAIRLTGRRKPIPPHD